MNYEQKRKKRKKLKGNSVVSNKAFYHCWNK
jgi:hypothetical protein